MKQIDWSEAPEWADRIGRLGVGNSIVWANDNMYAYADPGAVQRVYSFSDGGEHSTGCFGLKDLHGVQYRPTQWRGAQDELPPAGSECLASWLEPPDGGGRLPEPVLIKGYHGDERTQVWFTRASGEDMIHLVANCYFEPLKTEDQAERDKAIDAMADDFCMIADRPGHVRVCDVYDAGYRKMMSRTKANDILMNLPFLMPPSERRAVLDKLGFKE